MEQRSRRTELQRTVSSLFCVESRVSVAFPLFDLFTMIIVLLVIISSAESWVYQLFSIPRFKKEISYPFNTSKS